MFCVCHNKRVEVRGKPVGIGSLLPLCGFWELNSSQPPSQHYTLSYLPGPSPKILMTTNSLKSAVPRKLRKDPVGLGTALLVVSMHSDLPCTQQKASLINFSEEQFKSPPISGVTAIYL